jgi:glucose-6-phosphate-specific signal transduction histidine kinase
VELGASVEGDAFVMRIRDDGVGIRPDAAGRGLGWAGMRHRILALGGSFEARGLDGGGTEIEVRLPLEGILAPPEPQAELPLADAEADPPAPVLDQR